MKANKILKRIAKIEALMSKVTERSSVSAPHIQELLRDAKAAITRAKKAVSLQASSGTAKNPPAKSAKHPSKATPEPSKPKRKLSAAGRRAISEATKKRWAAKRAAAKKLAPAVAKKTAVKKVAAKKATPVKAAKARPRSCESPGEEGSREGGEGSHPKSGEESPGEEGGGESPGQESCQSGSGSEDASPSDDRGHHGYDARTGCAGTDTQHHRIVNVPCGGPVCDGTIKPSNWP